jgi:hypothetical protein
LRIVCGWRAWRHLERKLDVLAIRNVFAIGSVSRST